MICIHSVYIRTHTNHLYLWMWASLLANWSTEKNVTKSSQSKLTQKINTATRITTSIAKPLSTRINPEFEHSLTQWMLNDFSGFVYCERMRVTEKWGIKMQAHALFEQIQCIRWMWTQTTPDPLVATTGSIDQKKSWSQFLVLHWHRRMRQNFLLSVL